MQNLFNYIITTKKIPIAWEESLLLYLQKEEENYLKIIKQ